MKSEITRLGTNRMDEKSYKEYHQEEEDYDLANSCWWQRNSAKSKYPNQDGGYNKNYYPRYHTYLLSNAPNTIVFLSFYYNSVGLLSNPYKTF